MKQNPTKPRCERRRKIAKQIRRTRVKTTAPCLVLNPDFDGRPRSADWEAARSYRNSGFIYEGRIEGFNGGGLLVRFHSLVGFLPFPQLSPSQFCKEPTKSLQEIAKGLTCSLVLVKVIKLFT